MECKLIGTGNLLNFLLRINRNIVECKFPLKASVFRAILELIETLWNVNDKTRLMCFSKDGELIETLWNVN